MLRRISEVAASWQEAGAVFDDLRDTLHEFRRTHGFGRGISAVQIGAPKRLIYLEYEGREWRLRNPRYEYLSEEKMTLWDDCFSFPNLMARVERSAEARILYDGESGSVERLTAAGALSELLQHEMDHLDGILAVDRAMDKDSLCTRQEFLRQKGLAGA